MGKGKKGGKKGPDQQGEQGSSQQPQRQQQPAQTQQQPQRQQPPAQTQQQPQRQQPPAQTQQQPPPQVQPPLPGPGGDVPRQEQGRGRGGERGGGRGRGGGGGPPPSSRPPSEGGQQMEGSQHGGRGRGDRGGRGGGRGGDRGGFRGQGKGRGDGAQQRQEYTEPYQPEQQGPPPQQYQQPRPLTPHQYQQRPPPPQQFQQQRPPPPQQYQQRPPPPQQFQQQRPPPPQQYQQQGPPPQQYQQQGPKPQPVPAASQAPRASPPHDPSPELTQSMAAMKMSPRSSVSKGAYKIPERKIKCDKNGMVGTRGRPIEVEVNHLLLTLKRVDQLAIHYDCNFVPDKPKKMLRLAIQEMQRRFYPNRHAAFDGRKNLYSYGLLPFGETARDTVSVPDDERSDGRLKEFDVTLRAVGKVDLSQIPQYFENSTNYPQDAIQVLDIVLRNPSTMRFTPVGRSYFTRPTQQIVHLGNGLELWYGFYQTAVLGWRPFLNVDVAHKGFPEPKSLLDVMMDCINKYNFRDPYVDVKCLSGQTHPLKGNALDDFAKFIRSLKVLYMIPNQPQSRRIHRVNGLSQNSVAKRFTLDDGRNITVGEYFEREKRYPLRFPYLPTIHVGNKDKDICIPAELCSIVAGQAVNRKLDAEQTANMVRAAARPADERKRRIMDAMKSAGFNRDPCVNEFGVTVAEQFHRVKARILNPPRLEYANNKMLDPNKGVWRADRFLSTKRLERWVVLSVCGRPTRDSDLSNYSQLLVSQGRTLGMSIDPPSRHENLCNISRDKIINGDQLRRALRPILEGYKKEGMQLVAVIVGDRPPDSYSKVKLCAEVDVGILTQCVKEFTCTRKMNPATAGNILLKINAKLNGVNHSIDRRNCPLIMNTPTMLVGADVTHPSPDQTNIPSVAAVAASHDDRAFQYNMIWRLQPAREEIIQDLQAIMREQLMFFFRKTNQKPQKVIVYRDGVSEGQFVQVLESELSAIRRACQSLQADYQPRVTFLVVQKRHHTRFFPTRPQDEDGKNKNVPAGTIVDTMITHPVEMDFYLVSHASLQGTSRPTKYHKLWDENDIGEDDLEELTYYLCHLFSRCTRSVSYPAPTYYAHLAAFRGRVYLEGSNINMTNLGQEMNLRKIQDTIVKDSPMFFV